MTARQRARAAVRRFAERRGVDLGGRAGDRLGNVTVGDYGASAYLDPTSWGLGVEGRRLYGHGPGAGVHLIAGPLTAWVYYDPAAARDRS